MGICFIWHNIGLVPKRPCIRPLSYMAGPSPECRVLHSPSPPSRTSFPNEPIQKPSKVYAIFFEQLLSANFLAESLYFWAIYSHIFLISIFHEALANAFAQMRVSSKLR
jgi:hypothetical protein